MLTSLQVCFNAVAPLFLIMALGYGAKCLGAISVDAVPSLNKLAFRYFMPVMLFRNLYDSSLSHAVQPRLLLFAVAAVLASPIPLWAAVRIAARWTRLWQALPASLPPRVSKNRIRRHSP